MHQIKQSTVILELVIRRKRLTSKRKIWITIIAVTVSIVITVIIAVTVSIVITVITVGVVSIVITVITVITVGVVIAALVVLNVITVIIVLTTITAHTFDRSLNTMNRTSFHLHAFKPWFQAPITFGYCMDDFGNWFAINQKALTEYNWWDSIH